MGNDRPKRRARSDHRRITAWDSQGTNTGGSTRPGTRAQPWPPASSTSPPASRSRRFCLSRNVRARTARPGAMLPRAEAWGTPGDLQPCQLDQSAGPLCLGRAAQHPASASLRARYGRGMNRSGHGTARGRRRETARGERVCVRTLTAACTSRRLVRSKYRRITAQDSQGTKTASPGWTAPFRRSHRPRPLPAAFDGVPFPERARLTRRAGTPNHPLRRGVGFVWETWPSSTLCQVFLSLRSVVVLGRGIMAAHGRAG